MSTPLFLLNFQRLVISNRTLITRLFQAFEVAILLFWLLGAYLLVTDFREYFGVFYDIGRYVGMAALFFYCTTLIPGIITRLQVLPALTQPIATIITPFRRHFGISMFLLSFTHMGFTTTLPLASQGLLTLKNMELVGPKLMGFLAFATLFPLWLTSNDYSVKKLGKKWKLVHRLTYIAVFLIFAHVALFQKRWAWVMLVMIILLVASWIRFFWRQSRKASPVASTPTSV